MKKPVKVTGFPTNVENRSVSGRIPPGFAVQRRPIPVLCQLFRVQQDAAKQQSVTYKVENSQHRLNTDQKPGH